jgi:hypothetical protein
MILCGFSVINYDNIKSKYILDKLNEIDCMHHTNSVNSVNSINKYNKINYIYNEELNKILGDILHNIYQYSGYQVILSNVPNTLSESNKLNESNNSSNSKIQIDCEHIYDTIVHYIGKSVIHVFQLTDGTYLIQFANHISAKECCALLNNNMIGKNIITVEYIEKTDNFEKVKDIKDKDKYILIADIDVKKNDYKIYNIYKNVKSYVISFVKSYIISFVISFVKS